MRTSAGSGRELTWNEARAYVASRFELASEHADGFSLLWELEMERGASVIQEVSAQLWEGFGEIWIAITAGIDSALDPRDALELTGDNLIGALGIDEGKLVVRHTAPLASLTGADLERLLEWVGREAAELSCRRAPAVGQDVLSALFCTAL